MCENSRQHNLEVAHNLSDAIMCLQWDYATRLNSVDERTHHYVGEMVRQLDQVQITAEWIVAMLEQGNEVTNGSTTVCKPSTAVSGRM